MGMLLCKMKMEDRAVYLGNIKRISRSPVGLLVRVSFYACRLRNTAKLHTSTVDTGDIRDLELPFGRGH